MPLGFAIGCFWAYNRCMKRWAFTGALPLLFAGLCAVLAGAPGTARAMSPERLALFSEAVETAAAIDAYESYCKTPRSRAKISDRILAGAQKRQATADQIRALTSARDSGAAERIKKFESDKPDCKNVDFLFEKYVLIQKLEDQTFAIMDAP